ncbi:MAG: hypothetical protein JWO67_1423 [Streptosporangiaceae bacterium]|nr:hypothetical protein [Streptosporangiaceae bacterium]
MCLQCGHRWLARPPRGVVGLDPRLANQTVSTLAFEAGFGDLSEFNRAFKARYGLSPRQLRSAPRSVVASRS